MSCKYSSSSHYIKTSLLLTVVALIWTRFSNWRRLKADNEMVANSTEALVVVEGKEQPGKSHEAADISWQATIDSLGRLGLVMVYFFICDR